MLRHGKTYFVSAALTLVLLAATAYGQAPEAQPANMESEVAGIKAENAALKERLRRVEEQQRQLREVVNQRVPSNPLLGLTAPGLAVGFIKGKQNQLGRPARNRTRVS